MYTILNVSDNKNLLLIFSYKHNKNQKILVFQWFEPKNSCLQKLIKVKMLFFLLNYLMNCANFFYLM